MSKDFYVLRSGRTVYAPGHYDIAGAERTALATLRRHPKSPVKIVQVVYERGLSAAEALSEQRRNKK